jgi:RimJ/RimL family protein N-acetyltransferase
VIITDRLIIRPPEQGDAKPLNEAINRSLAEISLWMPWASDPSLKPTEDFIERGIEQWAKENQTEFPMIIKLKSNNQIISASGFNEKSQPDVPMFEIGYWIDSQYSGNGYITEAVNAITQYAFDKYNSVRVQICAQLDNKKSISVAKRCGFIQEAILKNYRLDCLSKKPCDEVILACFSKDQLSFLTPTTIE